MAKTYEDLELSAFERYRDSFASIVQGGCEECGNCDDDQDGNCACDRIVNSLLRSIALIDEEAEAQCC